MNMRMYAQKGDFLLARLAVPPAVSETLRDNDAVLLSKEDPTVISRAEPNSRLH